MVRTALLLALTLPALACDPGLGGPAREDDGGETMVSDSNDSSLGSSTGTTTGGDTTSSSDDDSSGSDGDASSGSSGDHASSSSGGAMEEYEWDLPEGFPLPAVPEDNPMSAAKVELGRYLFYDVRLSENQTQSCGSCHEQALAFTDGLAQPLGSTGDLVLRSSMGLANVAYSATHTWSNPLLENLSEQAAIPLFGEQPVELGAIFAQEEILERLRDEPIYGPLFEDAYPEDDERVSWINVRRAIASFERSLISGDAPYDQFQRGDEDAISESAKRGANLFFSERLECHHCHNGFNFTNSTVHAGTAFPSKPFMNTGLYNIDGTGAYPEGGIGLAEFTLDTRDVGKFKPPSLRNIALTAPYMHDGSVQTLGEVLDFYAAGGRNITEGPYAGDGREHPNKSSFVIGFELSEQERADVLAFLESLTDQTFITNPAYADPWR